MICLEICANSIQSALNAQTGGASRIEVCQNLEEGGITPSYGLIKLCKQELNIPIHVLIRPRSGDFVYDARELEIMMADIQICRDLRCDGVVIGILNNQGTIDTQNCRKLVDSAAPMQVTFHRAFDDCIDQIQALEDVIELGCTRILTSGGRQTAEQGIHQLADIVSRADGRILVMPGSGVSAQNAQKIIESTRAKEIHASAKQTISPESGLSTLFASTRVETDLNLVKEIVHSLQHAN